MASTVGTAVGYYFGGPLGGAIGGLIGGAIDAQLFAPDLPDQIGPRLENLAIQTSTNGVPIKRLYSKSRIGGNVFWARPLNEYRHKDSGGGGKGGPSTPDTITYTYTADFAVGLCEGEIDDVRKIWLDTTLVYDVSDTASNESLFSSNSSFIKLTIEKDDYADGIDFINAQEVRLYKGSETQPVDPFIEADDPDTPAYRGTAYIVFEGLELEKFSNRRPNVTVEAIKSESTSAVGTIFSETSFFATTQEAEGSRLKVAAYGNGVVEFVEYNDEDIGYVYRMDLEGNLLEKRIRGGDDYPFVTGMVNYYSTVLGANAASTYMVKLGLREGDLWVYQGWSPVAGGHLGTKLATRYSTGTVYSSDERGELAGFCMTPDGRRGYAFLEYPSSSTYKVWSFPENFSVDRPELIGEYEHGIGTFAFAWPGYRGRFAPENGGNYIWVGGTAGAVYRYAIESDGSFTQVFTDSNTFGIGDYDTVIADNGVLFQSRSNGAYRVIADAASVGSTDETLQAVVTDISTRNTLLDASDIDVTGLSGDVRGYTIDKIQSPRSDLEPLRSAFSFDAIESDWKIKFVHRGQASIATILEDDLATHQSGTARPDSLIQRRLQDQELPREVSVKAPCQALDYQATEQTAKRRVVNSQSVKQVVFSVVLTEDEAAQLSDTLLYSTWGRRVQYSFTLPIDYLYLDAGDVITITTDTADYLMQITEVELMLPVMLSVKAVSEELASYTSARIGASTQFTGQTVGFSRFTDYVMIDGPLLAQGQHQAGFYLALSSPLAGWGGASLYRSTDGGYQYSRVAGGNTRAIIGSTTQALESLSDPEVVSGESINVFLNQPVYSATETQFLNRENLILIGEDGRWEVVAFQNVTEESNGSYTLDTLLRGLAGTERNIRTHQAGDKAVVLVNDGGILDIPMTDDDIGVEQYYKVVTDGTAIDAARPIPFTLDANRLKPLSPVNITPNKSSNDFVINWNRRTRYSGEWRDAVDVPLGEASEEYEMVITGDDETSVTKTGISSETYTYTSADQITDFGSNQDYIGIDLYQKSEIVGRGYPGLYLFDGYAYLTGFRVDKVNGSVTVDEPNHSVALAHTDSFQRDNEGVNFISQMRDVKRNHIHIEFYRTKSGTAWNNDTGYGLGQFTVRIMFDIEADDVVSATSGASNKHQMFGDWNVVPADIRIGMREVDTNEIVVDYKEADESNKYGNNITPTVHESRSSGAFNGTDLIEFDLYPSGGDIIMEMREGGTLKTSSTIPLTMPDYSTFLVAFHHHNHYASSTETIDYLRIQ